MFVIKCMYFCVIRELSLEGGLWLFCRLVKQKGTFFEVTAGLLMSSQHHNPHPMLVSVSVQYLLLIVAICNIYVSEKSVDHKT